MNIARCMIRTSIGYGLIFSGVERAGNLCLGGFKERNVNQTLHVLEFEILTSFNLKTRHVL